MILGGFFADQGFKLGEGGGAGKSDLIPRYITADHGIRDRGAAKIKAAGLLRRPLKVVFHILLPLFGEGQIIAHGKT